MTSLLPKLMRGGKETKLRLRGEDEKTGLKLRPNERTTRTETKTLTCTSLTSAPKYIPLASCSYVELVRPCEEVSATRRIFPCTAWVGALQRSFAPISNELCLVVVT